MEAFFKSTLWVSKPTPLPYLPTFTYWFVDRSDGYLQSAAGLHRYGSTRPVLPREIQQYSYIEKASALQAWLLFGLISQFFEKQIDHRVFIKTNAETKMAVVEITEENLKDLLSDWIANLSSRTYSSQQQKLKELDLLLQGVLQECDRMDICKINALELPEQNWLAEVMLSVRLLLSLFHAIVGIAQSEIPQTHMAVIAKRIKLKSPYSSLRNSLIQRIASSDQKLMVPLRPGASNTYSFLALSWRFEAQGWCPIRVRQLCQTYDYAILSYLAGINQRRTGEENPHAGCAHLKYCTAYNLTRAVYKQAHFQPNCASDCSPYRINRKKVIRMIDDGKIPILGLDLEKPDLDPRLMASNGATAFIAISHVWSDGLGNPADNALPMCQLRRIGNMLRAIDQAENPRNYTKEGKVQRWAKGSKRLYFWMDTLFVPLKHCPQDKDTGDTKKMALQYIAAIYEAADYTLIIDSALNNTVQDVSAEKPSRQEEISCRILGGKWIQRAWTLQEGGLARRCYFNTYGEDVISLGALTPGEFVEENKTSKSTAFQRFWSAMTFKKQQPELSGVYDEYYVPLKFLIANLLNESRKKLVRVKTSGRQERAYLSKMHKQFVTSWNQLLDRSATEPEDYITIFASLLNLNATQFAKMKEQNERLPTVLRSVDKIPLSLLFNTKNKLRLPISPHDAWVPTRVAGDRLSKEGYLTWDKGGWGKADLHLKVNIPTPKKNQSSYVKVLRFNQLIPWRETLFIVQEAHSDNKVVDRYVIQIVTPETEGENPENYWAWAEREYNEGNETYIIIDKELGSESLNGFTAQGARFSCAMQNNVLGEEVHIGFDQPVLVWTMEQWQARESFQEQTLNVYQHVLQLNKSVLTLRHSRFSDLEPRPRRPFYPAPSKQYPILRFFLISGLIAFIAIFLLAWAIPDKCISDPDVKLPTVCKGMMWAFLAGAIVFTYLTLAMYAVLRFRFRRRAFNAWLRSFKTQERPRLAILNIEWLRDIKKLQNGRIKALLVWTRNFINAEERTEEDLESGSASIQESKEEESKLPHQHSF
jgi:hypothetical protein